MEYLFSFNNKLVWILWIAHSSSTWACLLPSWSKRYFNSPVDLHQADDHPPPPAPAAPSMLSDSANSQAHGPDLTSWPCIYHQHTLPAGTASHLSQWLPSQLQHVLRNLLWYSDIIWENSTSKSKKINVLKCLSFRVPPPLPSYHC